VSTAPGLLVPRDQGEQRHRQRIGERRQRSRGADAVDLRLGLFRVEPPGGHRDGHEQQPDQRAGHTRGRHEEVMGVVRDHPTILSGARPG
jgi:hypothetical protein